VRIWGVEASTIRLARLDDVPAIERLIEGSVMTLQIEYTREQRQSALGTVFGADRRLIEDGTYFVMDGAPAHLVAAGGWSRRRTLFGSDVVPGKDDSWLDPATDAARIRAFFVHPSGLGAVWAR
jgi:hypothetical protein